jgi:hypothetical protein
MSNFGAEATTINEGLIIPIQDLPPPVAMVVPPLGVRFDSPVLHQSFPPGKPPFTLTGDSASFPISSSPTTFNPNLRFSGTSARATHFTIKLKMVSYPLGTVPPPGIRFRMFTTDNSDTTPNYQNFFSHQDFDVPTFVGAGFVFPSQENFDQITGERYFSPNLISGARIIFPPNTEGVFEITYTLWLNNIYPYSVTLTASFGNVIVVPPISISANSFVAAQTTTPISYQPNISINHPGQTLNSVRIVFSAALPFSPLSMSFSAGVYSQQNNTLIINRSDYPTDAAFKNAYENLVITFPAYWAGSRDLNITAVSDVQTSTPTVVNATITPTPDIVFTIFDPVSVRNGSIVESVIPSSFVILDPDGSEIPEQVTLTFSPNPLPAGTTFNAGIFDPMTQTLVIQRSSYPSDAAFYNALSQLRAIIPNPAFSSYPISGFAQSNEGLSSPSSNVIPIPPLSVPVLGPLTLDVPDYSYVGIPTVPTTVSYPIVLQEDEANETLVHLDLFFSEPLPVGTVLSSGTQIGLSVIRFSLSDFSDRASMIQALANFQMIFPAGFAASYFTLGLVQTSERFMTDSGTLTITQNTNIQPLGLDLINVEVYNIPSSPTTISYPITAFTEEPGELIERVEITFVGLPAGVLFSSGTYDGVSQLVFLLSDYPNQAAMLDAMQNLQIVFPAGEFGFFPANGILHTDLSRVATDQGSIFVGIQLSELTADVLAPDPTTERGIHRRTDGVIIRAPLVPQVEPTVAWRYFIDAAGRHRALRISDRYSAILAEDVTAHDRDIVLTVKILREMLNTGTRSLQGEQNNGYFMAPSIVLPDIANKRPGVIFMNGERIEFNEVEYDLQTPTRLVLKNCLRATHGTPLRDLHKAGSIAYDASEAQNLPTSVRQWVNTPKGILRDRGDNSRFLRSAPSTYRKRENT